MKTTLATILFLLMTAPLFGQKKEFAWLIGTWKLKDKNIVETWSLDKDGRSLKGVSMKVNGNESTILEETRLVYKNNSFYYVADITGNQGAIDFKISSFDQTSFISENPKHDFPKLIRYRYIMRDNKEFIEAAIEGGGKVIPYNFEKVQ